MWDCPARNLLPRQPASHTALPQVLFAQLPISAPPTGLGECFFFNSLFVRLPYSSIFCQFWLVFVFKFVIVLLVVRGGAVCPPVPPSWPGIGFSVLMTPVDQFGHLWAPRSPDAPPGFLPWVWGPRCLRLHPSYPLNGRGFFNSVIVGLPFSLKSAGSG